LVLSLECKKSAKEEIRLTICYSQIEKLNSKSAKKQTLQGRQGWVCQQSKRATGDKPVALLFPVDTILSANY
jgi:hypothetical protein